MKYNSLLLAVFLCGGLALAFPSSKQAQRQPKPSTFGDAWTEIFAKELGSFIRSKITAHIFKASGARDDDSPSFPDPWQFANTTHDMTWLFRQGEVNTYNPTVLGLSHTEDVRFSLDLSTSQVRYSVRFPAVTWQGDYNLWIDRYSIISPYPYETRRGNGAYKHVFHNVDYVSTFKLHMHPSGRVNLEDVTSSLAFESCDVWSENYTINSRPVTDWAAVSREWKLNFDGQWDAYVAVVEESIGFTYGSLFAWPYVLTAEEVVDVFRYLGADIIGSK